MTEFDAVVVGSGPNGLTAAARLARDGRRVLVLEAAPHIGGGLSSAHLTDGIAVHDICAAVLPFGVASPAWRALDLTGVGGVRFATAPVDLAHVLDDGRAVLLGSDAADSAAVLASLGADQERWRRRIGPFAEHFDALMASVFASVVRVPTHPLVLGRFGPQALMSATRFGSRFDGEEAAALFAGLAAHSATPLERAQTSAAAILLAAAAETVRWPVAVGGTQTIADALARIVVDHGGEIRTDTRVMALGEVPSARVVMFDTSPRILVDVCADRIAPRARRQMLAFRHGPGAWKVDYLLHAPVPWSAEGARRAGTVHVGGDLFEVAAAEQLVARGEVPQRPFLLCGQPSLADPGRAPGMHTFWAYTHVPQGVDLDGRSDEILAAVEGQLERFAPGFAEVVAQRHVMGPSAFEAHNPNMHGGDFAGGANDGLQVVMRPRPSVQPYRIPVSGPGPGIYLCSASTPPGAGAHGMCGWNAAGVALARELRD